MKVLMLNGSPNAKGSTSLALDAIINQLTQEGIESELVNIGPKPMQDCVECGKCAQLHECIFGKNDGVNAFLAKAKAADGFVFGTPVYYGHPSGRVLSFLDRLFFADLHNGYSTFAHKPVAAVAVARRAGQVAALDVMQKHFALAQMQIVCSTYWNEVFAYTPEDVPKDAEGFQTMRNIGRNLAWALKCIHAGNGAGIPHPVDETAEFTNFIR